MSELAALLDRLEADAGPADPVPATDGWLLVLAENIGYLVDDRTRWRAMADLTKAVGTAPEQILSASDERLLAVVVGMRPAERVARLRRCAELRIAGARWSAYPGIGQPGVARIELFTGVRPDARGRGIGKWLKAYMLDRMHRLYPDAEWISTGNADSNGPMLAINMKMGFKRHRWGAEYQISRDQLAERVEALAVRP